jgi:hypothetical protein
METNHRQRIRDTEVLSRNSCGPCENLSADGKAVSASSINPETVNHLATVLDTAIWPFPL